MPTITPAIAARILAELARPEPASASADPDPDHLTDRELDVLRLVVRGLRNKEIAERLHRSARTVDHHVESIFAKLGAANRAEATAAAWRLGLLAPDSPARAPK